MFTITYQKPGQLVWGSAAHIVMGMSTFSFACNIVPKATLTPVLLMELDMAKQLRGKDAPVFLRNFTTASTLGFYEYEQFTAGNPMLIEIYDAIFWRHWIESKVVDSIDVPMVTASSVLKWVPLLTSQLGPVCSKCGVSSLVQMFLPKGHYTKKHIMCGWCTKQAIEAGAMMAGLPKHF
jgi:hypothetical protein